MSVGESSAQQKEGKTTHGQESVAMHKLELYLTPSAIAGLIDPQAEKFESYKDPRLKCVPASHAWTPAGDILIGCTQGQLLRVSLGF